MQQTYVSDINIPTVLYQLRFCDGSQRYVFKEELSHLTRSRYTKVEKISVVNTQQKFRLTYEDGSSEIGNLTRLLQVRPGNNALEVDPLPTIDGSAPIGDGDGNGGSDGNSNGFQVSFFVHDHLGNTRIVYHTVLECDQSEVNYVLEHAIDYYPYGKVLREHTNCEDARYLTTHHERDKETGLDYRGARFYDSDIGRFLSLDPLAMDYPTLSDYSYVAGNPIIFIDPTGKTVESTHTDADGNVIAVYNDGDLGVYRHTDAKSEEDVDAKREETGSKSGGGELMGETYFWDEFIDPESGAVLTNHQIEFNSSWLPDLQKIFEDSEGMNLIQAATASRPGGTLDIKKEKSNQDKGRLLFGKYVSARSAGNYLAGFNAATKSMFGHFGVDFDSFQRIAGALHAYGDLNKLQMFRHYMGAKAAPGPYYGENYYQYRMSKMGYDFGRKTTHNGRKKSDGFISRSNKINRP